MPPALPTTYVKFYISGQHILEQILYKINMIYEYVDELDDLSHEHSRQRDEIIEEIQKKNHNSSLNHDSLIQF